MKKINIVIAFFLLILCIGCKKTYCPGFPIDLNYFPYSKNQELKFVNSQQNIRNFIVYNNENSQPWSYDWNCKCACDAVSLFKLHPNPDTLGIYLSSISGMIGLSGGEEVSKISISFIFSSSESLSKILYEGKSISYKEVGKYFSDTISMENEDNKIITKVVIAKGKGLLSYTTADGEEWKLVD